MAGIRCHPAGAAGVPITAKRRPRHAGMMPGFFLTHLGLGVGFNGLQGVRASVNQPVVGFEIVGQVLNANPLVAQGDAVFQGLGSNGAGGPHNRHERGGELAKVCVGQQAS